MSNRVWALWFLAVGLPGAIFEAGLQSELRMGLGFSIASILFIIIVAIATAEAMEFITTEREKSAWLNDIDFSNLSYEREELQSDIDEELNER